MEFVWHMSFFQQISDNIMINSPNNVRKISLFLDFNQQHFEANFSMKCQKKMSVNIEPIWNEYMFRMGLNYKY